jgi:hypothetical protein
MSVLTITKQNDTFLFSFNNGQQATLKESEISLFTLADTLYYNKGMAWDDESLTGLEMMILNAPDAIFPLNIV